MGNDTKSHSIYISSGFREREVLNVEKTVRYEAMKLRWKKLLKTLVNEYEGVRYCPKWYSACPENANEHIESFPTAKATVSTSTSEDTSELIEEVRAKNVDVKVMIPRMISTDEFEQENPDIELKSLGLICHENSHEELCIPNYNEIRPSSYEDKLSQVYQLLKSRGNSDAEIEVELSRLNLLDLPSVPVQEQTNGVFTPDMEPVQEQTNGIFTPDTDVDGALASENFPQNKKSDYISGNDTGKQSEDSENPECNVTCNISDLSEALADAMLEVDSESCTAETSKQEVCSNSSAEYIPILSKRESFDVVYPETSPRIIYDNVVHVDQVDTEYAEPEDQVDNAINNEGHIVYPNPFTLPAEYINNQESLYSKSDNFASLDFINLNDSEHSKRAETIETFVAPTVRDTPDKKNVDSVIKDTSTLNISELTVKLTKELNERTAGSTPDCTSEMLDTPEYIATDVTTENDTSRFDHGDTCIEATDMSISTPKNIENNNGRIHENKTLFANTPQQLHLELSPRNSMLYENLANFNFEENSVESDARSANSTPAETAEIDIIDCVADITCDNVFTSAKEKYNVLDNSHIDKEFSNKTELRTEKRPSVTTESPTGESLEKLPPWIAQIIKASTPPMPHTHKPQKINKQQKEMVNMQSHTSPINRALVHDKNILGIVEKASKYLQENVNSGNSTPETTHKQCDRVKTDEESNDKKNTQKHSKKSISENFSQRSFILQNHSEDEVDLSMNHTPKFKFVSNGVDDIDFQKDAKKYKSKYVDCPYCNFKPEDSAKIVLPASMGEDQLKFMEIQAQVLLQ